MTKYEFISKLAELVSSEKLDYLKIGDIEIKKSKHDFIQPIATKQATQLLDKVQEDLDLLFFSSPSSAKKLTSKEMQAYAANPIEFDKE